MKNTPLVYCILFLSIIMGQKAQAQDWPNLNKYQNENANLKPVSPGQKRIVFMGDSITEFWSITDPEYFTGKPYVNRGISGQTTPQMLVRFRADVIALKPAAVIILAGINDIAGNTGPATLDMIANNIFSMAELAKANQIITKYFPKDKLQFVLIGKSEEIKKIAEKYGKVTEVEISDDIKKMN